MAKIYIGVGHGGTDPGAVTKDKKRKEKDYTLKIATAVASLLKAAGHEVKQSRTTDITFPTEKKLADAKSFKPELAIDIHLNAFNEKAYGTEVYYRSGDAKGKTLATDICSKICATIGTHNRGAKPNTPGFSMVAYTGWVGLLIEVCFLDNDNDMAKLDINKAAKAIADAILNQYPAKRAQKVRITATKTVTKDVEITGPNSLSNAIAALEKEGYKITSTITI